MELADRCCRVAGRRARIAGFGTLGYGMATMDATYDEVYVYAMGRPGFLLQYVVDAGVVQAATRDTKPIAVVFGLVGLYLHIEMQFSGRQVQQAHREMARTKREWPPLPLPDNRGSMTAADVLAANAGAERDRAIEDWCRSVWAACIGIRATVVALAGEYNLAAARF